MWFIRVEVAQETSAPPPEKNPGSAPVTLAIANSLLVNAMNSQVLLWKSL